jgi:hypothetical protein
MGISTRSRTKGYRLRVPYSRWGLGERYRIKRVCAGSADLKELFEVAGRYRGKHLSRSVAEVAKAVRHIGREYRNCSRMSVKLFATATKSINSANVSKRLGFAGMRVTVQPLT